MSQLHKLAFEELKPWKCLVVLSKSLGRNKYWHMRIVLQILSTFLLWRSSEGPKCIKTCVRGQDVGVQKFYEKEAALKKSMPWAVTLPADVCLLRWVAAGVRWSHQVRAGPVLGAVRHRLHHSALLSVPTAETVRSRPRTRRVTRRARPSWAEPPNRRPAVCHQNLPEPAARTSTLLFLNRLREITHLCS